jgi:hypothetical protein
MPHEGRFAPETVAKAAEAHRPETGLAKINDVLRGLAPAPAGG